MLIADGDGVAQDVAKAVQYYLAATEGGNLLAHFNLAQMHRLGVGVMRSCPVAVTLYKRSICQLYSDRVPAH